MEKSANPKKFPSREDLIAAGRDDLAMAIAKEGGWLAFGWDLADEEQGGGGVGLVLANQGQRVLLFRHSSCIPSFYYYFFERDAVTLEDAGIDGILHRLAKERSFAFGIVSRKENESKIGKGEPATWRAWSNHRSGNPLSNFEATEIVCDEDQLQYGPNSVSNHLIESKMNRLSEVQNVTEGISVSHCPYDNDQENAKIQISEHLQHLELQLTSELDLFRSRTNNVVQYKCQDHESLLKELHKLSDALEFQQNEVKNARDLLRSTRAKLAVLEGKISFEATESQKIIEEKQRRLDAAERVIYLLRSVCIVWPNFASEVLLVGSFDGWTSQRRMGKSSSNVFSLNLKLYPGRYEIKFVVDGIWTVDPLRPVVKNNGFENNLLIVT
ncbi:Sucrose nonfermenting 4-like protein [Apostasia shenzhenica]|uniref:Sucrose nonfermenting 4-like protein n=1 Tax=Apostasia shenzhenica TaxID=1088818 RepID=A0A2H9ZYK8_9ASPA|nr:Sucrose nonfermenting 4-like protein [Apostasia shenzhenica]